MEQIKKLGDHLKYPHVDALDSCNDKSRFCHDEHGIPSIVFIGLDSVLLWGLCDTSLETRQRGIQMTKRIGSLRILVEC